MYNTHHCTSPHRLIFRPIFLSFCFIASGPFIFSLFVSLLIRAGSKTKYGNGWRCCGRMSRSYTLSCIPYYCLSVLCFVFLVPRSWRKLPTTLTAALPACASPAFMANAMSWLKRDHHTGVCLFCLFHILPVLQPVTDEYQYLSSYKRSLSAQCWYTHHISLDSPIYFFTSLYFSTS